MPYDPQWPQNGQVVDADRFREQFGGLKDLIDAIQGGGVGNVVVDAVNTLPPGSPANVGLSLIGSTLHFTFDLPQGQEGQAGPPFAQAVVDAVNTVDPGQPAAVGVSFDGTNVRFTFDIPRGQEGSAGPSGSDGSQGPPGNDGAQGPPFAQAVVDGVTTLDPGQPATVDVSFDGANVHFQFGVPRGQDGPAGEVSQAQLDNAISGTSSNTNTVATLDNSYGDPEAEELRQKLNELINALRRW